MKNIPHPVCRYRSRIRSELEADLEVFLLIQIVWGMGGLDVMAKVVLEVVVEVVAKVVVVVVVLVVVVQAVVVHGHVVVVRVYCVWCGWWCC